MCKCVASVYKPRCLEPPLVQPPYMLSRTSHLSRNVREVQGVRGRCSVGLRKVLQGPPPCARMVFSMLSPGEELGPPLCRQRALRCGGWRCARLGGMALPSRREAEGISADCKTRRSRSRAVSKRICPVLVRLMQMTASSAGLSCKRFAWSTPRR